MRSSMVETSSRNRVPPSASSNLPGFLSTAPVNDPFSCPNSSLAISSWGMAPVCTATNGPSAILERAWMARATSSLPVPLSPMTRTVESPAAAMRTRSNTASIDADRAVMPSKVCASILLAARSLLLR